AGGKGGKHHPADQRRLPAAGVLPAGGNAGADARSRRRSSRHVGGCRHPAAGRGPLRRRPAGPVVPGNDGRGGAARRGRRPRRRAVRNRAAQGAHRPCPEGGRHRAGPAGAGRGRRQAHRRGDDKAQAVTGSGARHWMVAFGLAVAGHAAVIAIAAPRPDGADGERAAGTPDVVWGLPVAAIADDVTALQPGEQDPATVPPSGVEVAEAVPPPDAGAEIVTEAIDPSEMAVAEAIRPPEAAPAAASTETPALDTDAVDEVGAAAVATARDITPPLPRPRPQRVKRAPAQRTVAAPATDPKADRRDRGVARGAAAPAGRQAGDGGKRREHGGSSDFASYSGRVAAHL